MTAGFRLGGWFQGPRGSGQGGWTAKAMQDRIDQPVTIALRRPIPLETDMRVIDVADDEWHLVEADVADSAPVLIATPWRADVPITTAISIAAAAEASTRFPLHDDHPVPVCFSCGSMPDSMQVHAGPLGDGRWASDWTVPDWAIADDGSVEAGTLWAAIDCAMAWYVGNEGGRRHAVTAQLAVEMVAPLRPGAHALVAWAGDNDPGWDGRKRHACGAVFDEAGQLIARSRSFWIAVPEPEKA